MPIQKEWVTDGIDERAINWAKDLGEKLTQRDGAKQELTTSQIRRFYGEMKRIQTDPVRYKDDIPLLKAKLAYAVGRNAKRGNNGQVTYTSKIIDFFNEISPGIDACRPDNIVNDFKNFVKLIEAVVAYHKFYGGN